MKLSDIYGTAEQVHSDDDGFHFSTEMQTDDIVVPCFIKHSVKHTYNAIHSQGWHYFLGIHWCMRYGSMHPLTFMFQILVHPVTEEDVLCRGKVAFLWDKKKKKTKNQISVVLGKFTFMGSGSSGHYLIWVTSSERQFDDPTNLSYGIQPPANNDTRTQECCSKTLASQ